MNVHPTENCNFVIHVPWTFMSEIRPNDINAANTFRRITISPRAKLVGEGDGHECPSLDILVRESTKRHLTV